MTKEKRYFYMSCEQIYHGLHGMYTSAVVEGTYEEVSEIAERESYDIMDSYGEIDEDLRSEVEDIMDYEDCTEDEAWEMVTNNNVEFYVWEIDEKKAKDFTTKELDEKSADCGYEMFVDEYCIK